MLGHASHGTGAGWKSATSVTETERQRVARIKGVDPERVDGAIGAVLAAQAKKWGAPLLNHLIYARRPTIFRGARAMWAGLEQSGLLDRRLVALVNVRVAALNGCEF